MLCKDVDMTASEIAASTRTPLLVGQVLPWASPEGRVTVTLQRVAADAYVVTTYQGPTRLDGWCRSYADETSARTAARHIALAFRELGDERGIETRRIQLAAIIAEQVSRVSRRMHNAAALAAAEAEYDALLSLTDLAARDQLADDLAAAGPASAPVVVARPRTARPLTTTCTRRQPVKRAVPVTREYRTTQFRNGRTQRQCWAATTIDGAWRIERQDDINTVWIVFHVATGHEVPTWFGTLNRALAAIGDGYADSTIPTIPVVQHTSV
jgi:hypothetical protein